MFNFGTIASQIALHDEIEPFPDLLGVSKNGEYNVVDKNKNYHHPKGAKNTAHHSHRRKGGKSGTKG